MRGGAILCACAAVLLLAGTPSVAYASNQSVMSTFVDWTTRFGTDADVQARAANDAPLSTAMWKATTHVRDDALQAARALKKEQPTTASGRRARATAIKAFSTYASGERELLLYIRAARNHHAAVAIKHFGLAQKRLGKASRLLQQAATLAARL